MIYNYSQAFPYNQQSISLNAPDNHGVYYIGVIGNDQNHYSHYVGRALGNGVTIKSRLLDHLRNNDCPGCTHFMYRICTTQQETEQLEIQEIQRLQPKYNNQHK